jgi:hypothetical protein
VVRLVGLCEPDCVGISYAAGAAHGIDISRRMVPQGIVSLLQKRLFEFPTQDRLPFRTVDGARAARREQP